MKEIQFNLCHTRNQKIKKKIKNKKKKDKTYMGMINFNCVKVTQTGRKSTLIGSVKFTHIFFKLCETTRKFFTKFVQELGNFFI